MSAAPPVDDGGARHLVVGLPMPRIALEATSGDAVDLAATRGRVVVFIYPWTGRPGAPNPPAWDDIPGAHGSTPEAEGFARLHPAFIAAGVQVFGLSGQDSDWQREFAARMSLPFPLLADAAGALRAALHLPTFETGGITYLSRLTLILSDGRIETAIYPVHPPETHADEVLAALRVFPVEVEPPAPPPVRPKA